MSDVAAIFGQSFIYAAAIVALGAIELSSQADVFQIKTEEGLQELRNDLKNFLVITVVWILITSIVMYHLHQTPGLIINLIVGFFVVLWITILYHRSIDRAEKRIQSGHHPCSCNEIKKMLQDIIHKLDFK